MSRVIFFLSVILFYSCKKETKVVVNPPAPQPPVVQPIDPSTLSLPLSAAQVNGAFEFTKLKGIHPRLLYTSAEITQIGSQSQTDVVAKPTYVDVIARADALIGSALLDYGLDAANLRITNIHTIGNDHIPYLVLAYQFTKNVKYAARAWDQLNRMCTYPDWGANRHFLDAGIAAKAVALAYDGLYDYLTPIQRTQLYNAVRTFVLAPGKNQIDNGTGVFRWYDTKDNWNGICHGGMIMAALATYEMDSSFNSSVISTAANGMLKYIQSFDPDGASAEGLSYWSYGLSNTFLALESIKRCLGSTFGLTSLPGFRKTGYFPYQVSGPVGTATFGDDYIYAGKEYRFLSYCWFSKFFNDANMASTHLESCLSVNAGRSTKLNGWTDLLFYDKNLASQGTAASQSNAGYVRGVDYAYLLELASNDNSLYAGMHGGDNNANHGHLDAGSFFIQGMGENWAQGNLGLQSPYPADYFTVTSPSYNSGPTNSATTTGRFYYYRVRTEGKNCLVFNPDARPEQDPSGVAMLEKQTNENAGGFFVFNLKDNYKRDVSQYKRGMKLNRNSKVITVQDEFTPLKKSTVYWLLHTAAIDGVTISADGRTATMNRNGKIMYARILSPSNASFEKVNRSNTVINYLPETSTIFSSIMSGKNSANPFYGKLQIKLSDLEAGVPASIRVDFLTDQSTVSTPWISMETWTVLN